MTSGSVARFSRLCCAGVVVVVEDTVVDKNIAVLVFCCTRRDHISCVGGHPFDQSFRGAVFMILTAYGCSLRCGITKVY